MAYDDNWYDNVPVIGKAARNIRKGLGKAQEVDSQVGNFLNTGMDAVSNAIANRPTLRGAGASYTGDFVRERQRVFNAQPSDVPSIVSDRLQQKPTIAQVQTDAMQPASDASTSISPDWQKRYPNGKLGPDGSVIVPYSHSGGSGWAIAEKNTAGPTFGPREQQPSIVDQSKASMRKEVLGTLSTPTNTTEYMNGNQVQRFGPGGRVQTYMPLPSAPSLMNNSGTGYKSPQVMAAETNLYNSEMDAYRSLNGAIPLQQSQANKLDVESQQLPIATKSDSGLKDAQSSYYRQKGGIEQRELAMHEARNRIAENKNELDAIKGMGEDGKNYVMENYDPSAPNSQAQRMARNQIMQTGLAVNEFYKKNSGLKGMVGSISQGGIDKVMETYFPPEMNPQTARGILMNIPDEKLRNSLGYELRKRYDRTNQQ